MLTADAGGVFLYISQIRASSIVALASNRTQSPLLLNLLLETEEQVLSHVFKKLFDVLVQQRRRFEVVLKVVIGHEFVDHLLSDLSLLFEVALRATHEN